MSKTQAKIQRSNEPIFWLLFGAGGTVSALAYPIISVLLLAFSLGKFDSFIFSYEWMDVAVGTVVGKLAFFCLIVFPLWCAAHRLYHTLHDFKIHTTVTHKVIFYGIATVGTILTIGLLI